jgi:hypothetical protein
MNHDTFKLVLTDILKYKKQHFIIFTGGIGDFLAIDIFFLFSKYKNIIFISNQSLILKKILYFYKDKTSRNKFYSLYFNFSLIKKPGFNTRDELLKYFPFFKNIYVVDISKYFPIIREMNVNNNLNIKNSNIFFKNSNIFLKNIKDNFNIPEKFVLINPYTQDNRIHCIKCKYLHTANNSCELTRNFISEDYLNCINFLKQNNITGVIISINNIHIPITYNEVNIINLSNKLNIIECIELVKQCNYFFGIDGLFSVIASKILPSNNIYVKCNNSNGYNNKDIYWYPNKNINLQSFITI